MSDYSVDLIVLTFNEEPNLAHCLRSVQNFARNIFIVDSGSTDRTVEIAKDFSAHVVTHEFRTQAEQFNWALDNLPIKSEWVLRLDADECLDPMLRDEIALVLPQLSSEITGLYMKRRVYFLGQWIRHGGYYPTWLLRLFRYGKARSEQAEMDEHIILLEGKPAELRHDIIENSQKGLSFWIDKHNQYAGRLARELLAIQDGSFNDKTLITSSLFASREGRKRWLKQNLYVHLPLFFRSFLYFLYRYLIRLGFLDGKAGLVFHFLQGFWYLFLVDAKIYEYHMNKDKDAELTPE